MYEDQGRAAAGRRAGADPDLGSDLGDQRDRAADVGGPPAADVADADAVATAEAAAAEVAKPDQAEASRADYPSAADVSAPFDAPERPVTGEVAVDEALDGLGALADLPTAEHVAVYDDVHRRLSDALADIDDSDS